MSRTSAKFTIDQDDGTEKTFEIVPFIVPDDLMNLGAQAVAAEVKYGIDYESPATREARDHLILSRVTNRS